MLAKVENAGLIVLIPGPPLPLQPRRSVPAKRLGSVDMVGTTVVADPGRKQNHEVDFLAVREGKVVALGEAKPRTLGPADLERLLRIRDLLKAPKAKIVLASAGGVDSEAAGRPDVIAIKPVDVYG